MFATRSVSKRVISCGGAGNIPETFTAQSNGWGNAPGSAVKHCKTRTSTPGAPHVGFSGQHVHRRGHHVHVPFFSSFATSFNALPCLPATVSRWTPELSAHGAVELRTARPPFVSVHCPQTLRMHHAAPRGTGWVIERLQGQRGNLRATPGIEPTTGRIMPLDQTAIFANRLSKLPKRQMVADTPWSWLGATKGPRNGDGGKAVLCVRLSVRVIANFIRGGLFGRGVCCVHRHRAPGPLCSGPIGCVFFFSTERRPGLLCSS